MSPEDQRRCSGACLIEGLRECTPRCDIDGDGSRHGPEDIGYSGRRLAERISNTPCSHEAGSAVSALLNRDRR